MQALPIPSSINLADRSGDTLPADKPQVSWKRWAVRILSTAAAIVSAAFALSAIYAGFFTTAAVFGTITVVSTACAISAFSKNSTPSTSSYGIDMTRERLSGQSESTSSIVYSKGYEVVDVLSDGNCFFHAATVQCPDWSAHTLRQRVHEEARQWLYEYEMNRHLNLNEYESCRNPVAEDDLYSYLTKRVDHHGMTGLDAINRNGVWVYTVITPLLARVLRRPVISVNNSGTIRSAADANGFYLNLADNQLKTLDLNALGDFVLLEHINNNHFRGCRKRNLRNSHKSG
ncbi:hypothetical protein [Endozoicomonas atrinae]|uniref:hypothetical protein n=1 Tax=Endozoicomonas atrinae TaxID=1333660 RepID=UPI000826BC42|nr:hypothetical protein [Endozoicomonas atrinae]